MPTADVIAGWISGSTQSDTTVDLSAESVRKGAIAAIIRLTLIVSSGTIDLRCSKTGTGNEIVREAINGTVLFTDFMVPLDNDCKFDARYQNSLTIATNEAATVGYII